MTYKGVNADRLAWLLKHALTADEVSRFFKEKQKALILKGVKIQNLPSGDALRLALIQHFSDAAARVFAEWLDNQATEGESNYTGQFLAWFKAIETYGLKLPEEELRPLARVGLKALFADETPHEWLAYLRTDMGSLSKPAEEHSEIGAATSPVPDHDTVARDLRSFASWALGLTEEPNLESPELASAVRIANCIRKASAGAPPPSQLDAAEWNELLDLKRVAGSIHSRTTSDGFRTTPPRDEAFDPNFDYTSLDAICIPSRTPGSGPWFLDVLGFLRDREVITLSHAALLDALPEEGRVIVHTNFGFAPPSPGVAECFRIERYRSTKPIKIRATARSNRLLPVAYVPHASSDPDGVRAWIADRATQLSTRPSLLVLADGVAIRPRDDAGGNIGAAQFEWKFDRWNSMSAVELGQNTYAILPLSKPDDGFECPPVSVIAKRIFRSFSNTRELGVTRAQLASIAQRLADPELSMLATYRERVAKGVMTLSDAEAEYDAVVAELMRSPAVQRDISSLIAKRSAELDAQTKDERTKLENLQKATQQQQERLGKLKEQIEERVRETKTAIRKAFEAAREKESHTIGQLALWKELLGTADRERHVDLDTHPVNSLVTSVSDNVHVCFADPSSVDVATLFRTAGLNEDCVRLFSLACAIAKSSGAPIMFAGIGARYLSLALARALAESRVAVVDVGLGCISPDRLRNCLLDTGSDVVLILGIDHSDPVLFAPDLIDLVVERVALPPREADQKLIVMCRSSGAAALPIPAELEQLSIKLDLGSPSAGVGISSSRPVLSPLQQKLRARVHALLQARDDATDLGDALSELI